VFPDRGRSTDQSFRSRGSAYRHSSFRWEHDTVRKAPSWVRKATRSGPSGVAGKPGDTSTSISSNSGLRPVISMFFFSAGFQRKGTDAPTKSSLPQGAKWNTLPSARSEAPSATAMW